MPAEKSASALGELRALVVRGVGWKAASQVSVQIVSFGTTLVLVRLLAPHDFGLAAMALVFASLAFLIADFGLGSALVQRAEVTEADRSTAFWTSTGLGVLLTALGVGLAGPVASLYREPDVKPLFAVLSVTFLFTALGATQGALLIRDLRFRSLELRTIVGSVAGTATAIAVATLGYGAWALIAQALANSGVSTLLLWRSSAWRPRLVYSRASLRDLTGFGGPVFGGSVFTYLSANADNLLVGRFLGSAALGAYSIAFNILLIPLNRLVLPLGQVFFPALSRIREPAEVGAVWVRISRLAAVVTFAGFFGMAVIAPDFVPVVLGRRWEDAIPVLQILSLAGVLQAVGQLPGIVLMALDRASVVFRFAGVYSASTVAAFAIAVHWGIVAVAAAHAIVTAVFIPYYVLLALRATGVSARQFLGCMFTVAQAAVAMAIAVLGVRLALLHHLSAGPRLAVLIAVGVALYVPLSLWRVPEILEEVRALCRTRREGVPPVPRGPSPAGVDTPRGHRDT